MTSGRPSPVITAKCPFIPRVREQQDRQANRLNRLERGDTTEAWAVKDCRPTRTLQRPGSTFAEPRLGRAPPRRCQCELRDHFDSRPTAPIWPAIHGIPTAVAVPRPSNSTRSPGTARTRVFPRGSPNYTGATASSRSRRCENPYTGPGDGIDPTIRNARRPGLGLPGTCLAVGISARSRAGMVIRGTRVIAIRHHARRSPILRPAFALILDAPSIFPVHRRCRRRSIGQACR